MCFNVLQFHESISSPFIAYSYLLFQLLFAYICFYPEVASHKSYRPLTVLTFRWNFALSGLEPSGYHFTNLILHWLLCVTFMHVFKLFLAEWLSFLLAMLFLVNPIHTESVSIKSITSSNLFQKKKHHTSHTRGIFCCYFEWPF